MNSMTACRYKRGSEMAGHLLPTGFLMKGKIGQESNIHSLKKINKNLYLIAVTNLLHNTDYLLKYQRTMTFSGYSTCLEI